MRHRVWAIGWALGGVLLAAPAYAQCTKDTDCKGERVCEQGQCVNPAPPAALPPPPPPPPAAGATEPAAPATAPGAAAPAAPTPPPAAAPAPVAPRAVLDDDDARPRSYHRRSPGLMTTGIVLTSVAPLVLVVGAVMSASSYSNCTSGSFRYGSNTTAELSTYESCKNSQETRAYAILGATVVMLGVGIPLIVYGAKKVPDDAPQATLVPWATPTSGGATLRLSL